VLSYVYIFDSEIKHPVCGKLTLTPFKKPRDGTGFGEKTRDFAN
jgi:hypothetical protein